MFTRMITDEKDRSRRIAQPPVPLSPAFAKSGVKAGVLDCDISAGVGFIIGSSKAVQCTFKGNGRVEHYEGRIGKLGVDIGATGKASMAWVVFNSARSTRAPWKAATTALRRRPR